MNYTGILIVLSLSLYYNPSANAQTSETGEITLGTSDYLNEIPIPSPKYTGNYYMDNEFKRADLELKKERIIENIRFRYDLLNQIVEVKNGQNDVFKFDIVHIDKINSRSQVKPILINADQFGLTNYGMLKVISSSEEGLLAERMSIEISKADYNPALNVGSRNHEYKKKVELIYLRNGKLMMEDFKKSYSSLSKHLGKSSKELKAICKEENIDINNGENLLILLNKY